MEDLAKMRRFLGGPCPLTFEVAAVLLLPPDALPVTLATTGLCRKKTLRVPRNGGQRPLASEVAVLLPLSPDALPVHEFPKVLRRKTHYVCGAPPLAIEVAVALPLVLVALPALRVFEGASPRNTLRVWSSKSRSFNPLLFIPPWKKCTPYTGNRRSSGGELSALCDPIYHSQ